MLLHTKFQWPNPPTKLITRPGLEDKLEVHLDMPLVLVSAPAGYGKTALVARQLAQRPRSGWLSLDEYDNALDRFLRYLIAALRQIEPNIGKTSLAKLAAGKSDEWRSIIESLLNDLTQQTRRMWLVLDDYHLITDSEIDSAMTLLLENMKLSSLRIIIISRTRPEFPLARWHLEGHMAEIGANDFQFNLAEANRFFGKGWRPELIKSIHQKTEGWIAGMQAIKLATVDGYSADISVSGQSTIFDYFMSEVWERLSAETQQFLRQTSVLTFLNGGLCNAVVQRSDSDLQLQRLYRDNLFLIELEQPAGTYRYHHLFANMLQKRLQAEEPLTISSLHARAANWYRANELPSLAVSHALESGDFGLCEAVILQFADHMWTTNQAPLLHRWLKQLPLTTVESRPSLRLMLAWVLLLTGQWQKLAKIELYAKIDPTVELGLYWQGVAGAVLTRVAFLRNQPDMAIRHALTTLDILPEDGILWRGVLHQDLASGYRQIGDSTQAIHHYEQAAELSEAANNLYGTLNSRRNLGELLQGAGRLYQAQSVYQGAIKWAEQHEVTDGLFAAGLPATGNILTYMARLHMERWEPELAQKDLEAALQLCHQGGDRIGTVAGLVVEAELQCRLGDWSLAWATLEEAKTIIAGQKLGGLTNHCNVLSGLFYSYETELTGDHQSKQKLENWIQAEGLDDMVQSLPMGLKGTVYLNYLSITNQQGPLKRLLVQALPTLKRPSRLIEAAGRLALANWHLNAPQQAHHQLAHALELAQPQQFLLPFIECGEQLLPILDAHEHPFATTVGGRLRHYWHTLRQAIEPQTSSPLPAFTRREMHVSDLLQQGLSNRDIASRLSVAESTVKTHLHNIYRKLGVTNRAQAIVQLGNR